MNPIQYWPTNNDEVTQSRGILVVILPAACRNIPSSVVWAKGAKSEATQPHFTPYRVRTCDVSIVNSCPNHRPLADISANVEALLAFSGFIINTTYPRNLDPRRSTYPRREAKCAPVSLTGVVVMWQSKYLPTPIVQIVPGEYPGNTPGRTRGI